MKKSLLLLLLMLCALNLFAQTATNADGTIRFRGNVAILVNGNSFTFENGVFRKSVSDETLTLLKTSLRVLAIQKFQNLCFGVVNRDDEAAEQVQEVIEENKLEDYIDGFSVKAKGQGADHLFLIDITLYGENSNALQLEISTRLMNIENNMGHHYYFKSDALSLGNLFTIRHSIRSMVQDFSAHLDKALMSIFPEQYYVIRTNGKTWNVGAYQPTGAILETDKFYAFRFKKEELKFDQEAVSAPIQVLEKVAVGDSPSLDSDGSMRLKMNKSIKDFSDIVLLREVEEPIFSGTYQMPITFFGLDYDLDSYDGLNKNRINNAIYTAITRHPGLQLIEHDLLPELKKERELQKSEDFINGHVVEQMKAIGAMYLIKLEDYSFNQNQVSFKMAFISVEENRILRTVDVTSSIDNLDNEIYKQLCKRFTYPCIIKKLDKDKMEITSILSFPTDTKCIMELNKEVKNPLTEEISHTRINVCAVNVDEYKGNKCIVSIEEIFSPENMDEMINSSINKKAFIRIDGSNIESDKDTQSDVKKKSDKVARRKSFMNTLKKVVDGIDIKIE